MSAFHSAGTSGTNITGSLTIPGTLTVTNGTNITGSLSVSGAVTASSGISAATSITGSTWISGSLYVTGSLYLSSSDASVIIFPSGSLTMTGTDLDGPSAIGTVVGNDNTLSTAGAKLLSVQNNTVEKEYTSYDGSKTFGIDANGGAYNFTYFSELVPLTGGVDGATGTIFNSTNTIPVGALVIGVNAYVKQAFATGSTWAIGVSGSAGFQVEWGSNFTSSAGVSNLSESTKRGIVYYSSASYIAISCSVAQENVSPSTSTGSIRVRCNYITLSNLTS